MVQYNFMSYAVSLTIYNQYMVFAQIDFCEKLVIQLHVIQQVHLHRCGVRTATCFLTQLKSCFKGKRHIHNDRMMKTSVICKSEDSF